MGLPAILLIDKPVGITSFDIIRQLRKQTGIRKFGHAGTLDPLASGLMLIGVESGTKELTHLSGLDKEYVADILIGQRTTTGDREGEIVAEREVVENISIESIATTLSTMSGDLTLPVSGYSAIKVDGVPMYKRARAAAARGEAIPMVPTRAMKMYEGEVCSVAPCGDSGKQFLCVTIRFVVGSGTYIRSLAEELGRRLGEYPAHLTALRRTRIGDFSVTDAQQLDEIR